MLTYWADPRQKGGWSLLSTGTHHNHVTALSSWLFLHITSVCNHCLLHFLQLMQVRPSSGHSCNFSIPCPSTLIRNLGTFVYRKCHWYLCVNNKLARRLIYQGQEYATPGSVETLQMFCQIWCEARSMHWLCHLSRLAGRLAGNIWFLIAFDWILIQSATIDIQHAGGDLGKVSFLRQPRKNQSIFPAGSRS